MFFLGGRLKSLYPLNNLNDHDHAQEPSHGPQERDVSFEGQHMAFPIHWDVNDCMEDARFLIE